MTIKITTPNGGSDSLDFGCAQTPVVATVTGTEVSSGEGKLELKTTTGGTSATKATVLANGNVGIGSAAPTTRLDVEGSGVPMEINSTNSNSYKLQWSDNGTVRGYLGAYASHPLRVANESATEVLAITSAGDLEFNSGYGSAATAYGCRAWVNFNGTGTVAIRGSGNVSSITDNGTGDYTINFTTAMPDANYSPSFSTTTYTATNNVIKAQVLGTTGGGATTQTTTQLRFILASTSGAITKYDMAQVCASVFR